MKNETEIRVLVVAPGKKPEVKTISRELESLQGIVGGYIEAVYPWEDEAAIICNEEGKVLGMDFNRALCDETGDVYDVVAGTFIIAGTGDCAFTSLTDEQVEKYEKMYHCPQQFVRIDGRLVVLNVEDPE